jgi:hypothetical protein
MTHDDIERLRQCQDKIVTIIRTSGELLRAKIVHVNSDHRDVTFDLISTTQPKMYKHPGTYVIRWDDILDFHEGLS